MLLSADGYIVTNSHVVRGARRIEVRLPASMQELAGRRSIVKPGGRTFDARVIGMDRASDLAVIKIDRTDLSFLPSATPTLSGRASW